MAKNNLLAPALFIIIIIVIIFIFISVLSGKDSDSQEKFATVLGQLGPYQEQLNECINQCERSDPSNRLLSQANINCGVYCQSVMTDMANKGIPPKHFPIHNNLSKCMKQCDTPGTTPNQRRKCISVCHGHNEVADWCKKLWCPYSMFDQDKCMKWCTSTWNANNNQVSWTWNTSK